MVQLAFETIEAVEFPHSDVISRAAAAAAVAARYADDVDQLARFPAEAIAALKQNRLLGFMVPKEYGGESGSLSEMLDVCYTLGKVCASTAMIYAMHQTVIAMLTRFSVGSHWHENFLRRIVSEQLLLASSTTEGDRGGDLRASDAAVVYEGDRIRLSRDASCISYGEQADCIVSTARHSTDAVATRQVLLVLTKGSYKLTKTKTWDTMGMRGTCSSGFMLEVDATREQIIPTSFDRVNAQRQMPVAHLAWSAAWSGIAADALEKAQTIVMNAARQGRGKMPPSLQQFTKTMADFESLRALVFRSLARFESVADDEQILGSIPFQVEMNLLKVNASELAQAIVLSAMRICGLKGYRNDTEFSMGRHLRDILSAPIMIHNDRILTNAGAHAMLRDIPKTLIH